MGRLSVLAFGLLICLLGPLSCSAQVNVDPADRLDGRRQDFRNCGLDAIASHPCQKTSIWISAHRLPFLLADFPMPAMILLIYGMLTPGITG